MLLLNERRVKAFKVNVKQLKEAWWLFSPMVSWPPSVALGRQCKAFHQQALLYVGSNANGDNSLSTEKLSWEQRQETWDIK